MKIDTSSTPVIILAGGLGTRLRSVISDRPKALAPIDDRTILDLICDYLIGRGFREIIFSTGYMKEKIREHVSKRIYPKKISTHFSEEEKPLGTGGAIKKAMQLVLAQHALILNGDSFCPIDYEVFLHHHHNHNADISICLRYVEDTGAFGTVEVDDNANIVSFLEKTGQKKPGLMNAGIYLFRKDVFEQVSMPEVFSIEKDFFEKKFNRINIKGFNFSDYFIDIGTPQTYEKAKIDLAKS